jgi:antitoxin VapB
LKEEGLELQSWEAIITPWHQQENAFKQITNGLKMGSDTPSPDFEDVNEQLTVLRISLLPSERQRFAEVGRKCAEAMNKSIHQVKPGQSEFDIAAILNSETQKREVLPIVNLIATDERVFAYRHPLPTKKKLERYAMLVLCGRKYGLVCSITRFIHFGSIPDEIQVKANAVAKIDAALINSTKPGETLGSIFFKLQKQYAAVGFADEWQLHHQGGLAAYLPREVIATPNSEVGVSAGQAYAWNPSITGTKSEDTILIEEDGFKVITKIKDWPEVQVDLGDVQISRPSILVID